MKNVTLFAAAAVATLSLTACEKKAAAPEANAVAPEVAMAPDAMSAANATVTTTTTTTAAVTPIEPTPAATAAPASTEALISGVTLTDMYQVQAGKIAEAKAQAPAVKDFGKAMVTEHPEMTNQMKHLFSATSVKPPTELGARGKGMIEALNAAAPADFDKLYLSQQQAAQQAELDLLKGYADAGESTELKPAAAKAIPKAQAHLDKAQALLASMK